MTLRKYAGAAFGVVFSLLFAASAMANTIGPNYVPNTTGPGWNSEVFVDHTQNTDYFWIQQCYSTDTSVNFDIMHHWFALPSTGTQQKALVCSTNGTWRQASWANLPTADYSVEYANNTNFDVISHFWYQIQY